MAAEVASVVVDVLVEQVPLWLVLPLRQRVLRPHQRIVDVRFDGDEAGTHFAAFDEMGTIVGIASLIQDDSSLTSELTWRLRGMAVAPDQQSHGVGREIMTSILEFANSLDRGGIWCAARLSAIGFYERFGFVVVGEPYIEPVIGPHVRMERPSSLLSPQRSSFGDQSKGFVPPE